MKSYQIKLFRTAKARIRSMMNNGQYKGERFTDLLRLTRNLIKEGHTSAPIFWTKKQQERRTNANRKLSLNLNEKEN
jgi:hypothetical protein